MPKHLERLPLNPEKKEIRLLTILPDRREDSIIRCSLRTVSLDDSPQFEAVSYVWGNSIVRRDIIINDVLFYVTPSVEVILRNLRQPTEGHVVWIDFICMNQHDVLEKNSQVPLMGQIYADASSVIAYVGPDSANIRATFSFAAFDRWSKRQAEHLSWMERDSLDGMLPWRMLDARCSVSRDARREKRRLLLDACVGLQEIIHAAYWTRMWTFQEYHLPRREPVCVCGGFRFFSKPFLSGTASALMEAIEELGEPGDLDIAKGRMVSPSVRRFTVARIRSSSILSLLCFTLDRECKDPRDKVYALYSLVPDLQTVYPPDYTKSIERVMHETAAYIIRNEGGFFDVFHRFKLRDLLYTAESTLPSWVPDFTIANRRPENRLQVFNGLYTDTEPEPEVTDDLSALKVWGRVVGTCCPVFEFKTSMEEIFGQIIEIVNMEDDIWGPASTVRESLLAACLTYSGQHWKFSVDEIIDTVTATFQSFQDGKAGHVQPETDCWRVIWHALPDTFGKTVFVMIDSTIPGLGISSGGSGRDLETGDLVVVVNGLEQPLILRKHCEDPDQHYYTLVDRVYIDVISDRQSAAPRPAIVGIQNTSLEEFLIR